jgi:hypothetical protein
MRNPATLLRACANTHTGMGTGMGTGTGMNTKMNTFREMRTSSLATAH